MLHQLRNDFFAIDNLGVGDASYSPTRFGPHLHAAKNAHSLSKLEPHHSQLSTPSNAMSPETLRRLAQFDTPTICNVIELFAVRPRNEGYLDGRIRAAFPRMPPMVGFATTAAFRSDAPPGKGDAYGSLEAQLATFASLPGPAVVVFQDLDDPAVAATFGEVMCSTYQGFGSTGLITSGAGRDLEQVRALDYPVFTGGAICSHAYCHILHVGLPVRVGGLVVNPGDLLHGDANGVTDIPINIAEAVADFATQFIDAERVLMNYVRGSGKKTVAGFTAARQEFSRQIAELSQRARESAT